MVIGSNDLSIAFYFRVIPSRNGGRDCFDGPDFRGNRKYEPDGSFAADGSNDNDRPDGFRRTAGANG